MVWTPEMQGLIELSRLYREAERRAKHNQRGELFMSNYTRRFYLRSARRRGTLRTDNKE